MTQKKARKTGRGIKTVAATAALVVALSGTAQAQAAADQYAPGGGAAEQTALVA